MERNRERRVIMSMVEFVFIEVLLVTLCGIKVSALSFIPAALVYALIWGAFDKVFRKLSGK